MARTWGDKRLEGKSISSMVVVVVNLFTFVEEERCQNPRPKTRKPNPNPREENGKKKRTGREKGKRIFPYPKTDASLRRRSLDFDR